MSTDASNQFQPPSAEHLLGTDMLGRDVLSRLLYGGRHTLSIALCASFLAASGGVGLGLATSLVKQQYQFVLASAIRSLLAIPNLLLAFVVLTVMGQGDIPIIVATGFAQIAPMIQIVRSHVLMVRAEPYVEAGRAIGLNEWRIMCFYILPNISYSIAAYTAVTFSYCVLNSSALAFMGLMGQPGNPDWGVLLQEGRSFLRDAPWIALTSGGAITLTVWTVNSLFDNSGQYRKSSQVEA